MKKKRLFKSLVLLFSSSLALGTFLSLQLADVKDKAIAVYAYEGTPLPTSGTLSSGTYYLSSDLTVSSQLKITSGDVIVNLNGHTLNGGGRDKGIFHVTGGTLTVNGKDDETGNRGALNNGGGYYPGSGYSYGGALYITAGAATLSDLDITNCQSNWGGAIQMSNSAVTLNNCNLSNNMDTNGYGFYGVIRVGDSSAAGTGLTVNGGEMFSNDGAISVGDKAKVTINGAYIHDNEKQGVSVSANEGDLKISGNTIIKDNNSSPRNLVLNNSNNNIAKVGIISELGNDAYIGVTISGDTKGVFTNNADTSLNDASKFFSDDSGYAVGKNDDGQLFLGVARTVTYSTEYGTAPDSVTVASGCTIPSEPISPTAEGHDFLGWYKESTFENAWDFATDTVDSDITLYAKWLKVPTASITKGTVVTNYDSFASALSNWVDGSTLTLLRDTAYGETIEINDNVIFDLNGHGINIYSSTDKDIFHVNDGGSLTLNDSNPDAQHKFNPPSGNAGLATLDEENGTLVVNGGYVTGYKGENNKYAFHVEDGGSFVMNGGNIIGNEGATYTEYNGSVVISGHGHFTLNGGFVIYNKSYYWAAAINFGGANSLITINGGVIAHNYGRQDIGAVNGHYLKITGGSITDNYTEKSGYACGVVAIYSAEISGNPIIKDNLDPSGQSNFRLGHPSLADIDSYINITGELGDDAYIGMQRKTTGDVATFTNSTDVSFNDVSKFHSDKSNYVIGKKPDGQLILDTPKTVTYITERGTAPDSDTVANGSVIYNEPTSPSQEGYEFKGWYKDEGFENAWDFETDTVTADTTLYAKWDYDEATANVIKLINDIGDLTYDGGANDSLDDIIAAKAAYDALTPGQKEVVNGVNKDVLDHDILTYNNVDKVGDLIAAIPTPSASDEYYDAITLAKTEYDKLTPEEVEILNSVINFEQILNDNIAAKEVIDLINDIGNITHGGEDDSKEAIEAARTAYDNLTDDQKALVDSSEDSSQDIENAEKVYEAMEAIDAIGEVGYDNASDEAIEKAREIVDSLTDEQKEILTHEYIDILVAAETKSNSFHRSGDLLFWILFIIVLLTLVSGLFFLFFLIKKKREKDNDNNGNGPKEVKAMSVGGFLPAVTLINHYLDTRYIILYVLAGVAVLVWAACLVIAIYKKKNKAAKAQKEGASLAELAKEETQLEASKVEEKPVVVNDANNEEEEETVTVTDEKGNIFQIRFIKSFTAKLIQSPEETKKYYEELKNEVLSYKKTNSRVSWHYDSINSGRNQVIKFAVRGKTLCVYFPLNADEYEDSKYKVEKVESKKYEDVPCLYRIKNDRRCEYAKELIAVVAANLGLEKGEEQHEVYSNLPYEENKPLVARGLIKELKVQVNKPADAPVVLESKVNAEGDEVVLTKDSSGNIFEIRYIKSFTAKLSQSEDEVKDYYTILKNYVLSYKGVHSRVSWHYDAFNVGRDYVLKFAIRGKTLCVYYALDASKLEDKYKVEEAKGRKFEDVPVLYRIKNDRRCEYAKELIDLLMKEHGLDQGDIPNEDYRINKESTKALLAKGLIKEVKSKVQDKKVIEHYESITVSKADEVMSDEKAAASLEEVEESKRREGSKEIINIDTLSENYKNGDEVTIESLIKKKLVSSKAGYVKILARGELDKKLHVVANDYSLQAIKMIVLMGGTTKKIK